MITVEYLRKELESLKVQHAEALSVAQQATGAMLLIESLLKKLEEPSMTLGEFGEALGAKSIEIEPIKQ